MWHSRRSYGEGRNRDAKGLRRVYSPETQTWHVQKRGAARVTCLRARSSHTDTALLIKESAGDTTIVVEARAGLGWQAVLNRYDGVSQPRD